MARAATIGVSFLSSGRRFTPIVIRNRNIESSCLPQTSKIRKTSGGIPASEASLGGKANQCVTELTVPGTFHGPSVLTKRLLGMRIQLLRIFLCLQDFRR